MRLKTRFLTLTLVLVGLTIVGCAPSPARVTTNAVQEQVDQDKEKIYQHGDVDAPLTLADALARALLYNLDVRVAEMDELIAADDVTLQMMNALPSISAKKQRIGRSNKGGSSSFSLLTGTQSLQPSISTDQYRDVSQLSVEADLLDVGINIWRGHAASDKMLIAEERRRKVYHSVAQDTYAAFWRAAVAQTALPEIENLLSQTATQMDNIQEKIKQGLVPLAEAQEEKSALVARRQQLLGMKQALTLADTELKTLIDYPLNKPVALDLGGKDWLSSKTLPRIKGDMDAFQKTAFLNRPEVREEILNKRISERDIELSILETFPGLNLLFTQNYDQNSFLAYDKWTDGIFSLTASINKILTAPIRYNRAKSMDELADKRRQALLAAVITQVHVARARNAFLTEAYRESELAEQNARDVLKRARDYKDAGMMSGSKLISAESDAKIAEINRAFAYADVQDSYGRFITTLGVDLWDAGEANLSVPDFARQIKKNLANEDLFITATTTSDNAGVKER